MLNHNIYNHCNHFGNTVSLYSLYKFENNNIWCAFASLILKMGAHISIFTFILLDWLLCWVSVTRLDRWLHILHYPCNVYVRYGVINIVTVDSQDMVDMFHQCSCWVSIWKFLFTQPLEKSKVQYDNIAGSICLCVSSLCFPASLHPINKIQVGGPIWTRAQFTAPISVHIYVNMGELCVV